MFRVGSKVVCIKPGHCNIDNGVIYTIRKVDRDYIYLIERGETDGYYHSRFEPANNSAILADILSILER